ncbi:uncharacterized protein LOC62_04G006250 [Vanrija pseudolonga]|uniref:Uncharacterized protein n=1 Tax=Vanrija pseudolonga TaxID=143232 RepID=A0AAF0YFC0_9TREE|nr:hypothetical protein LOC62_04G006250 [Vanrija pseudolonga]
MAAVAILALTAASFAGTLYAVFSDDEGQGTVMAEHKAAVSGDSSVAHHHDDASEKTDLAHPPAGRINSRHHRHHRARVHPPAAL